MRLFWKKNTAGFVAAFVSVVYKESIVSMVFAAQETACAAKDHGHAIYSHLTFATSKLMLVIEPGFFRGRRSKRGVDRWLVNSKAFEVLP